MKPVTILRIKDDMTKLELVGQIYEYESFIVERVWNGMDEFELTLNPNTRYAGKLQYDYIVIPGKCFNKAYVIEHRHLKENEEGEKLIIKGRSLKSILKRRIIYPSEGNTHLKVSGKVEYVVKQIINKCFIDVSQERKLPILKLEVDKNRGNNIIVESRYKEVYEEIVKAAEIGNIGWNIEIDPKNMGLIFIVMEGIDRSVEQSNNSRVIFSPDYKNVSEQEYIRNKYNVKNVAIVGGKGEGVDRIIQEVGEGNGWNRNEIFIDARDLVEVQTLKERGQNKLKDFTEVINFEGSILNTTFFNYEEDWNLGDKVTIMSKKWGVVLNTRVTKVVEVYEQDNVKIKPTFGDTFPNLIDEIKKRFDNPVN